MNYYCSKFSMHTGGSTVVQPCVIGLANDEGSMADLHRVVLRGILPHATWQSSHYPSRGLARKFRFLVMFFKYEGVMG